MPTADQYILFLSEGAWRLGIDRADGPELLALPEPARDRQLNDESDAHAGPEDQTVDAKVQAACDRLNELGYVAQPIALALPSAWCLCASITTDDLEGGNRRQALAFRFEEHLPISAEDMVADYVEFADGTALAVGTDLGPLRRIIDAFEARGVAVGFICPTTMLIAAAAVAAGSEPSLLLINNAASDDQFAGYDLLELRKGQPARWWWFADDAQALRERIQRLSDAQTSDALPVALIGSTGEVAPQLQAMAKVEPQREQLDPHSAATTHAAALTRDGDKPWVNLRRDALAMPRQLDVYRRPAGALAAAAALVLLAVLIVGQWRAGQYAAVAADREQKLVALYKRTLDSETAPMTGAIKGRLLAERRRRAGVGGRAPGEEDAALRQPSALSHLASLLETIHRSDLRLRILDVNIRPDLLSIDGQARSHGDAGRLALQLRQVGGFEAEQPITDALPEGGVSFRLRAEPGVDARRADRGRADP